MRHDPRLAFTAAALAVAVLGGAPAMAQDVLGPAVQAEQAHKLSTSSELLKAKVGGGNVDATYHFEYGTTEAYGTSTPDAVVPASDHPEWVQETVTGLTPATRYHFRVVASNANGVTTGNDHTFNSKTPDPVLGRTVVTAPVSGVVLVRRPGAHRSERLDTTAASIPAGSVVDATRGRMTLSTALGAGRSQTGTFWGGAFRVTQSRTGHGMTDIYLAGPRPSHCLTEHARAGSAMASSRRHRRVLWGRDRHGRFRTHGHNSVATVRGTQWATEETCAGTLTTVRQGRVVVRDLRRHRNVSVRAGHRYLARSSH